MRSVETVVEIEGMSRWLLEIIVPGNGQLLSFIYYFFNLCHTKGDMRLGPEGGTTCRQEHLILTLSG